MPLLERICLSASALYGLGIWTDGLPLEADRLGDGVSEWSLW